MARLLGSVRLVGLSSVSLLCTGVGLGQWAHSKPRFWLRLFSQSTAPECRTTEDVATYMKEKEHCRVVMMAGAGISTPSGIPDFRSPGSGLYYNLQKYNLPYPEAVFDIEYFHVNPQPFFALARELYPSGQYRPNVVHYFARQLHEKGMLVRMYTQNIDGLERLAGVPADKLVEAHGTFATATCKTCRKKYIGDDIRDDILNGNVPKCVAKSCSGVVKPDIVFFGEMLPERFYRYLDDMPEADVLIILGTSLEVYPFAGIADAVLPGTPRVLFNREAAGPFLHGNRTSDVMAAGDLVEQVWSFIELLGWKDELQELITKHES